MKAAVAATCHTCHMGGGGGQKRAVAALGFTLQYSGQSDQHEFCARTWQLSTANPHPAILFQILASTMASLCSHALPRCSERWSFAARPTQAPGAAVGAPPPRVKSHSSSSSSSSILATHWPCASRAFPYELHPPPCVIWQLSMVAAQHGKPPPSPGGPGRRRRAPSSAGTREPNVAAQHIRCTRGKARILSRASHRVHQQDSPPRLRLHWTTTAVQKCECKWFKGAATWLEKPKLDAETRRWGGPPSPPCRAARVLAAAPRSAGAPPPPGASALLGCVF
jgi:hypothetical protein